MSDAFNAPLAEVDPEVAAALADELNRQRTTLEMIASENFVPRAVLEAQGSVLTNKYAEGYPGRRYYGGCEFVDVVETLAIERAKSLFGAAFANVQPHSGASANAAVLAALAKPGDRILGLELASGGHLTHGMKLNFSGKLYEAHAYGLDDTGRVDMDDVRTQALEVKPAVLIAGWSAYPRELDFKRFREIADEVGAYLWVDMAHFAGLVAAGLHPSPVPHAHVTSSTVHKTIGGPRSGFILTNDEDLAKKINSNVFPGQQGGPLMHVIAAKATAFKLAGTPEFKDRQERTKRGAAILADRLTQADAKAAGVDVLTGGTDVHLVLVDLRESEFTGKDAEDRLHDVGITVNKNAVPNDPRPPMVTSGVRIGTPALATRGFGDAEFTEVADIIALALMPDADLAALRARVTALADRFPLYEGLTSPRDVEVTTATPLDGIATASAIKGELGVRIAALRERGVVPGLGTLLVGSDPGSLSYVGGKHRDSAEVGIESIRVDLPATASEAEVRSAIAGLNSDPAVTGYIVQLPLPAGIDENAMLKLIDPAKDADGLHPTNLGRLVLGVDPSASSGTGHGFPLPCTPAGIVELLRRHDVPIAGQHVVVIGRGLTVGRPLGLVLTRKGVDATVTLTHSRTVDLAAEVRRADIVVAAIGVPHFVRPEWIKPGAAVLDVGVTRVGTTDSGKARLHGDVDPAVAEVAGWLSPNPGGVGPMTRAMLLSNVVDAAERQLASHLTR